MIKLLLQHCWGKLCLNMLHQFVRLFNYFSNPFFFCMLADDSLDIISYILQININQI